MSKIKKIHANTCTAIDSPKGTVILMELLTLGAQIESLRRLRGYSCSYLARQLGMAPQQLADIEKGMSYPTVAGLSAMADCLQVPADYLLRDCGRLFMVFAIESYYSRLDRSRAMTSLTLLFHLLNRQSEG